MSNVIYTVDLEDVLKTMPGKPWQPRNGREGDRFQKSWCCQCERDKLMNGTATEEEYDADESLCCPILSASYRGEAKEWQYGKNGQPCCTAFVAKCSELPDKLTPDPFYGGR